MRKITLTPLCALFIACPAKDNGEKGQTAEPAAGAASSQPAVANSQPANTKAPAGQPFSGLVKLGDGLKPEDVKATDVLFVMARESQGNGKAGRLVAVQRHGKIEFPVRYEMSQKNVMVPGIPFTGPFIVMARLDKDGNPMTRGKEDLYGVFDGEVTAGQEGVHLVLKKGRPKEIKSNAVSPPSQKPSSAPASQPTR